MEAIVDTGAVIVTVTLKDSEHRLMNERKAYHWTEEGDKTPFRLVKFLLTFGLDVECSLANLLVSRSLQFNLIFRHNLFHDFSERGRLAIFASV
jgi:hypothetical protein